MRHIWSISVGLLATLLSRQAQAQGVGAHRLTRDGTASVELATTASLAPSTDDVTSTHVAETLAAALRVGSRVVLTLDATLAFTSFRPSGRERRTSTRPGNPMLTAQVSLVHESSRRVELGAGVAPPLVTAPGGLDANSAAVFGDRVALEARGSRAPWLWSNNAVPLVVLASAESEVARRFRLRLEAQPGYLLSVNRRPSRFAFDTTLSFGWQAGPWLPELALHGYAQSVPIRDGDYAQLSAAGGLRYDQPRWWARGDVAVNLDGPAGFAETNRTPWGVTIAGGVRF